MKIIIIISIVVVLLLLIDIFIKNREKLVEHKRQWMHDIWNKLK